MTAPAAEERISNAVTFLEGFLTTTSGRTVYTRTDVADLVLDVTILLQPSDLTVDDVAPPPRRRVPGFRDRDR